VTFAGEMMRGRHTAAILEMMEVGEMTVRTIDEYVSLAVSLGRDKARRAGLSVEIASKKHRVYRDRQCIVALEAFLEKAVRNGGV
jgi:protein O-GlcNAc transferase